MRDEPGQGGTERGRGAPPEGDEPDPRWSLANERTFLAYNRTALALLVAGLAVSGSHTVVDAPVGVNVVGIPLVASAAAVAYESRIRFHAVQRAMRLGEPLPPPRVVAVLSRSVALVAIVALPLLVWWAA